MTPGEKRNGRTNRRTDGRIIRGADILRMDKRVEQQHRKGRNTRRGGPESLAPPTSQTAGAVIRLYKADFFTGSTSAKYV